MKMEKGLLITRPNYDDVTEYLSIYSKKIISKAKEKGLNVFDLKGSSINMETFNDILKKLDYNFIVFNCHGNPETIFGHKNSTLIKLGQNNNTLFGRIIYARSCDVGQKLGKSMKEDKKGCFIGYKFKFKFCIDETRISSPQSDNTAKIFLNPSNMIPKSLIKGNSAIEAQDKSKKQIAKNMKKIIQKGGPRSYLEVLWNNLSGMVLYGNENAKIN